MTKSPQTGLSKAGLAVLDELLRVAGPSGHEDAVADLWCSHAERFAQVRRDGVGNAFATVNPGAGPRIALFGHMDEIGVVVTSVDESGFLRCTSVGGWDAAVLAGQRVRLLGPEGDVHGTFGRKPIHQLRAEGSNKQQLKVEELWIDIGADDGQAARALAPVGTPAVLEGEPRRLGETRLMSRALDNRVGIFTVLEAARRLAGEVDAEIVAVATVHEEIGGAGARAAAFGLQPRAAIVVDVTPGSDTPAGHELHEIVQGKGPVITRGASMNGVLVRQLIETARKLQIPYQLRGLGRRTSTDADSVHPAGAGVRTALLSVPGRYLHTPGEIVDLRDVAATILLMEQWAQHGRI